MKLDTKEYEGKMIKSVSSYRENLSTIRAGKANPDVLKKIEVQYYGSPTAISSIAEVKVTDPHKTIRDQISSIVAVFELPKIDNGGNPIQYLLGQIMEDGDEPEILEFEDADGREQALVDYNVQPGDHLHLISVPIAG